MANFLHDLKRCLPKLPIERLKQETIDVMEEIQAKIGNELVWIMESKSDDAQKKISALKIDQYTMTILPTERQGLEPARLG